MNLRPSGYEPDELPDCSTPQQRARIVRATGREFKKEYERRSRRHCREQRQASDYASVALRQGACAKLDQRRRHDTERQHRQAIEAE